MDRAKDLCWIDQTGGAIFRCLWCVAILHDGADRLVTDRLVRLAPVGMECQENTGSTSW